MITSPRFGIARKFDLKPDEINKQTELVKELLSLSKEKYREVMENKLKELFKGVTAFEEIAKKIIDTRDVFYVTPILARVLDREMHLATKLSENLDGLPVYIRHLDYIPEINLFTFKMFIPATKDMLDKSGERYDEIPQEQKKVIEKTLDEVNSRYNECILKIELDKQIPTPIIRIYNRDGCWISWVFKMLLHPEFWTKMISELPLATRIPFIATPYYEFVMLMSDRVNQAQMRRVKEELTKEAKKEDRHSIELSNIVDIEISYSWFENRGILEYIRQKGKIDEKIEFLMTLDLEANISSKGFKTAGMIIGENVPKGENVKRDIDIASKIWEEEVIKNVPNYRFSDKKFEKCVIKGEFKLVL